jgi:DNA-directed RNA polymerase subunit RPC12/RpoP
MWARRGAPAEIAFPCPRCGKEAVCGLDGRGRCRSCGAEAALALPPELRETRVVESCPACGSALLYVQRDFNQKAGLAIVAIGAALAPFTPYYSSLMVAALVDAVLYVLLPEITVCYRCHAHFRGFARNPRHQAFDLHVAEQYDVHPPSGG